MNITHRPQRKPITIERIKEMLLFCAEMVDRIGPAAQPLVDRLEKEYLAAKRGSEADRIRKLLDE